MSPAAEAYLDRCHRAFTDSSSEEETAAALEALDDVWLALSAEDRAEIDARQSSVGLAILGVDSDGYLILGSKEAT